MGTHQPPCIVLPFVGKFPMKYVSLVLLVAQTVGAILTLHLSRKQLGPDGLVYLTSTAVLIAEVFKLFGSAFFVWHDARYSFSQTCSLIVASVCHEPRILLKVSVPAVLYSVQNNLIFVALSHISPALYQVTYQLKILTTALLSVVILRKRLSPSQWISLLILTAGVACIQVRPGSSFSSTNLLVGLGAILTSCFTSGLAGVYLEKILKDSPVSIWLRNFQLALLSILLGGCLILANDWEAVQAHGFLQGYTAMTWIAIAFQGLGGLIIASVLKYADNILKCFGSGLAIVFSCLASWAFLSDFVITRLFLVGTTAVMLSAYAYGVDLDFFKPFSRDKNFSGETRILVDETSTRLV